MIYLKNKWNGLDQGAPVEQVRDALAEIASAPTESAADAVFKLEVAIARLEDDEGGMLPEDLSVLLMLRSVHLFLYALE